jgi:hypothetical protein
MRLSPGVALAVVAVAGAAWAQQPTKLDLPRPSPNATFKQTVGLTDVTVTYSSPAVHGRKIWGAVVPYDEVWRAGANECSKLTLSTPATIEGKPVPAGTYCLFLLPTKAGWTFILSKDASLRGADGYKAADDVLRVPATATTIPARERLASGRFARSRRTIGPRTIAPRGTCSTQRLSRPTRWNWSTSPSNSRRTG